MGRIKIALVGFLAFFLITALTCGAALAAGIRVAPSSARVVPGGDFYIDIVAEGIPAEGLGGVQFRLNLKAPGGTVVGVTDLSQAGPADIAVATPLLISQPTATRSGIGDFFWNGRGASGILVMDNESLVNGSALYTFAHTNGSTPPTGSGSVARFMVRVGPGVNAERIDITLSDVMLLDGGPVYPLDYNIGASVQLRCMTKTPSLIGLSLTQAQAALASANLLVGNVYELDNQAGSRPLNVVLEQSSLAGSDLYCQTPVNMAINTPPSDITQAVASDKRGDDTGAVLLSWTPSISGNVAGYRVYLGSTLLRDMRNPSTPGCEIGGLTNGVTSQLRVTAYDTFGNESQGVTVPATPIDDVPPTVTIAGVTEGAYYRIDVTPQVTIFDTNLASQSVTLNGAPFTSSSIAADGTYTLIAAGTDRSGNQTTKTVHFTIDKTPPTITVASVSSGGFYNTDVAPVVTVTDANLKGSSLTLNSQPYASGAPVVAEGTYMLTVNAEDLAGNTSTLTISFIIDKTPPISTADVGLPKYASGGVLYITGQTPLTVSAQDSGIAPSGVAGIDYRLDSAQSSIAYTAPVILSGLADGTHTVTYNAYDRASNRENAHSLAVTVDNAPPVTAMTLAGPSYSMAGGSYAATSATVFNLQATDLLSGVAKTERQVDGGQWAPYLPFSIPSEGNHTIGFRSTDNLGNLETVKSQAVLIDNTQPVSVISVGTPQFIAADGTLYLSSATTFTIAATDNLSGVARTEYRIDGGAWTSYAPFAIATEGKHVIGFRSVDNVGNVETEKSLTVTIDNTPPVTVISVGAPKYVAPDGAAYVTSAAQLTLAATDHLSGVARTEYRLDGGTWTAYAPFAIASEGSHTIGYRSTDNVGNLETEKVLTIIVDNTPPVSLIAVGAPQYSANGNLYISGRTGITISATDNLSGVRMSEYSIDGAPFTTYSAPITLAAYPEGNHTIAYRSTDNVGNVEKAKQLTIVLDKTPPKTAIAGSDPLVQGVVNTVSPVTAFTLTATDNLSGVKNIWYRIDGGQWQLFTTGFTLTGLKAGQHVISFSAVDNVENEEPEQIITVRLIIFETKKGISTDPVVLLPPWEDDDKDEENRKKTKINALETMLDSLGISYYAARDEDDFELALRSGRYNIYLLTDGREEEAEEEIREGVYYGDGLICIKTRPDNDDDDVNAIFGVRFTGKSTNRDLAVTLAESPLGPAGTFQTTGKTVVATITSSIAKVFGTVTDKRGQFPAVVYNEYGRGRALLFTFDLVNSPDGAKAADLLLSSLSLVKPKEHYLRPLDSVPVKIEVNNSTEPFGLEVDETIPPTTTADTITPVGALTGNVITWRQYLAASEKAKLGYYLNLPDAKGDYTTTTETRYANYGNYRLYDTHDMTLKVETCSADLLQTVITDLLALPAADRKDRKRIAEALSELNQIRQTIVNSEGAEENIERITEAAEEVAKLTIDAGKVRVQLDELLKIWQRKWYLLKVEEKEVKD